MFGVARGLLAWSICGPAEAGSWKSFYPPSSPCVSSSLERICLVPLDESSFYLLYLGSTKPILSVKY
jgi:hypothetical protein